MSHSRQVSIHRHHSNALKIISKSNTMKNHRTSKSIHCTIKANVLATMVGCGLFLAASSTGTAAEKEPFKLMEMLGKATYVEHTPEQAMAQLKGKKIIGLYFTAKWCAPCRQFSPKLVKFRNEHKDDFQFVMMSWDKSLKDEQAYLAMDKMEVPAVRFDDELIKEVGNRFRVDGVPTLLIFDGEGKFITGNGQEHLRLAIAPGDLAALGDSAGVKFWREVIAPYQAEAMKVMEADRAELAPVVEKHKDFPRLKEIYELEGYFGKDREITRLIAQIGKDIAADWNNKKGFIDEMVTLAVEFKPNRKGYRGLFEAQAGPCFDELGKQAVKNPEIYAKLEALMNSGPSYVRDWGLRGVVNAAVAGNEQAFEKVADCKSMGANVQLQIFPALKDSCDEGNPRALDLALKVYVQEPYYIYAAIPVFVKSAYAGNEKALDAMAAFCRSGKAEYEKGARSVLEEVAKDGSAHAKELLQQLKDNPPVAASEPVPEKKAKKQPASVQPAEKE